MKKWTTLDECQTPDGSKLALVEHDGEYVLRVGGRELMSTKRHASELRLGEVAGEGLRAAARVLIGGLGLGFTLRGALARMPQDSEVIVAELMPAVVSWNRNAAWPLAAKELADPRCRVVTGDVFDVLASHGPFDAIALDADNGTTAMMTAGNRALYAARGLARVKAALRPGGVAAYWSAVPDRPFEERLRGAGFSVRHELVPAYGSGGPKHAIIIGRRALTVSNR